MSTIQEIVRIGVGMPDREKFARFSHDVLGFPTTNSPDGTVTYMRPVSPKREAKGRQICRYQEAI
jgi:hypothetical protein